MVKKKLLEGKWVDTFVFKIETTLCSSIECYRELDDSNRDAIFYVDRNNDTMKKYRLCDHCRKTPSIANFLREQQQFVGDKFVIRSLYYDYLEEEAEKTKERGDGGAMTIFPQSSSPPPPIFTILQVDFHKKVNNYISQIIISFFLYERYNLSIIIDRYSIMVNIFKDKHICLPCESQDVFRTTVEEKLALIKYLDENLLSYFMRLSSGKIGEDGRNDPLFDHLRKFIDPDFLKSPKTFITDNNDNDLFH